MQSGFTPLCLQRFNMKSATSLMAISLMSLLHGCHSGQVPEPRTGLGKTEATQITAEDSPPTAEDVQNMRVYRKFGLKTEDAPHVMLFSWLRAGARGEERTDLKTIGADEAREKLFFSPTIADCKGYKLDAELRSAIESASDMQWLRVSIESNADVVWLSKLPSLRGLSLHADIANTVFDLRVLENLTRLEWLAILINGSEIRTMPTPRSLELLCLSQPNLNTEMAKQFGTLPKLRVLNAEFSKLDDAGFVELLKIGPNLEILNLFGGAPMSDNMIDSLLHLKRLRLLDIGLTDVRFEQYDRLRTGLPDCIISIGD